MRRASNRPFCPALASTSACAGGPPAASNKDSNPQPSTNQHCSDSACSRVPVERRSNHSQQRSWKHADRYRKNLELDTPDFTSFPKAVQDHIVYTGLRNLLMDSHAGVTAEKVGEENVVDKSREAALRAFWSFRPQPIPQRVPWLPRRSFWLEPSAWCWAWWRVVLGPASQPRLQPAVQSNLFAGAAGLSRSDQRARIKPHAVRICGVLRPKFFGRIRT